MAGPSAAEPSVGGPIELAVIEFPGSNFTGEIAPELADIVGRGIVTILDLVFVTKQLDGSVTSMELANLDEQYAAPFKALEGEVNGLLSEADLQTTGAALSPGSSAVVVVWENTWARRLATAVVRSGGRLVAHDRLDAEAVQEALARQ
jgi:Family of unknown function (DUF6325)